MNIPWQYMLFLAFDRLLRKDENIEEFNLLAFGDDYIYLMPYQLIKRWNIRHGDKYQITLETDVNESSKIMVEMWRNSK